jgi:hypothetical protein
MSAPEKPAVEDASSSTSYFFTEKSGFFIVNVSINCDLL